MHGDVCTEDRRVAHMREEVSCMRTGLCARSLTISIFFWYSFSLLAREAEKLRTRVEEPKPLTG
jgi:hypothetical protein